MVSYTYMHAVILAAGKGTRLRPLTNECPKPMIELLGKPILAHAIDFLPPEIKDIIIVVGYHGDKIKEYFKGEYHGHRVCYVEQREYLGPAHALFTAREALPHEPFLLAVGDNINVFSIPKSVNESSCIVYAYHHETPERFGVIELNDDGKTLKSIQEKPKQPASHLISTGTMLLRADIFSSKLLLHPEKKEYFMPPLIMETVARGVPVSVVEQDAWIGVDAPEDIPVAELSLMRLIEKHRLEK